MLAGVSIPVSIDLLLEPAMVRSFIFFCLVFGFVAFLLWSAGKEYM